MFLTDFDKACIRAVSVITAAGRDGDAGEVRTVLLAANVAIKCDDLGKRLAMLRREGQLPEVAS